MNITVSQTVRPIKFAIIVVPESQASYLRAIHICSSFWGGAFFPILPFYKLFSKKFRQEYRFSGNRTEFYVNTIENFDPDIIVIDDRLSEELIRPYVGDRKIVSMGIVEESYNAQEDSYGITIEMLLKSLNEQQFKYTRTDGLKVKIPIIGRNNLFAATLLGSLSSNLHGKIKEGLPKQFFSFVRQAGLPLGYCEPAILNAVDVTLYGLNLEKNKAHSTRTAVFLINSARIQDLLLFWNLRALGWNIIALPVDNFMDQFWVERVQRQQYAFHNTQNFSSDIYLQIGFGIQLDVVLEVMNFLADIQVYPDKPIQYVLHRRIPRFWHTSEDLHFDKAWATSPTGHEKKVFFEWDKSSILRIDLLKPTFDLREVRSKRLCYVNQINYLVDSMQPQFAQVFPSLPSESLEKMIWGEFRKWRFSRNGRFFLAAGWDMKIDLSIITSERVFSEWFAQHNLNIRHSAAGKLGQQLLINIGNMHGVNAFANPGILPILSLFEGGKVVNKNTLFSELGRQWSIHREHFYQTEKNSVIDGLIRKAIIQAGFQIQCSICNQHSFYTLGEINDTVRCSVCQNMFSAPIHNPDEIKWSYRGLGPFSRNNRAEGIIAVLLTLRFFRVSFGSDALLTSTLSFEILEDGKIVNEVDLALFYQDHLKTSLPITCVFCECKTEIDFAKKDVERMKRLGNRFPGSMLVFATLKTQLSLEERKEIGKLVRNFRGGMKRRPRNPVLILTARELMGGMFSLQHFSEEINSFNHYHDDFGRLCDITCREYLGVATHESEVNARITKAFAEYEEKRSAKKLAISNLVSAVRIFLQKQKV